MDDISRSSPITFIGGIAASDEGIPATDQGSQIGGTSGSLQGEGILSGCGDGVNSSDVEFGFQRLELGKETLVGTVQFYERHVFLCYKTPHVWPPRVETPESDRLPRLLSAALAARKGEMKKRTRLTICEGEDGTESSNGDVLIFPDMIRYRSLTHFDAELFVEEVLVKDGQWLPGAVERLTGSFVFVCCHGNRDRRCGVCGPVLIRNFKEEINVRGIDGQVSVSPCSHIGGHKYAGNVIIFSSKINEQVTGHWYGYVTPNDVPLLLEQHITKGEIVNHLWRGQMGLSEEDQKKAQELRLQMMGVTEESNHASPPKEANEAGLTNGMTAATGSCCQGIATSTCCQYEVIDEKLENSRANLKVRDNEEMLPWQSNTKIKPRSSARKTSTLPSWFQNWEPEDTYAVLAFVTAIASISVAYTCYRRLR